MKNRAISLPKRWRPLIMPVGRVEHHSPLSRYNGHQWRLYDVIGHSVITDGENTPLTAERNSLNKYYGLSKASSY